MEDDSILLLEYESNNRITENMYKYIDYVLRISRKYYEESKSIKKVNVAVIYASNIEKNQYFIIAGVLTSTDKFIDEEYANMVRSWLKMTKVEKIFEKEKEEAMNKAEKDKVIEIAKKAIKKGMDNETVNDLTDLSIDEIELIRRVLN